MEWICKDETCHCIEDIIKSNTGLSIQELQNPKEMPFVKNISEAAHLTRKAIVGKVPITIVGDYDCDGVSSTSILDLGITEIGGDVTVIIPKRFSEGYGINMSIIDSIDSGLLITVDNGITAVEQIKKAKEKGLAVIVIDHHRVRDDGILPPADVIVDPHAVTGSEYDGYCGAGLVYRFIMELNPNTELREKLIILAGIGTIADVVPLTGDNRRIVTESLRCINLGKAGVGINLLLSKLKIETATEEDYAYKLGPCLNAPGRLLDDGACKAYELLSANPPECSMEAIRMFEKLDSMANEIIALNEKRKELVAEQLTIAEEMIGAKDIEAPIILYSSKFFEGIVGIIAGKIAEKYRVPALIFADSEKSKDRIKGSGRSVDGIDLKALIDKANDCFIGYGGHTGAAGMVLHKEMLVPLKGKLTSELKKHNRHSDEERILYDLEISPAEICKTAKLVRDNAPYGEGCPEITFLIRGLKCVPKGSAHYTLMGKYSQHIKLFGTDGITYMGFDMAKRFSEAKMPMMFDVIGKISFNYYAHMEIPQVEIIDFKPCEKKRTETYEDFAKRLSFI